jgi:methyl coenzyme M reductase subunit D
MTNECSAAVAVPVTPTTGDRSDATNRRAIPTHASRVEIRVMLEFRASRAAGGTRRCS